MFSFSRSQPQPQQQPQQPAARAPEEIQLQNAIQQEFEELLTKKLQHVVPGKKVFSMDDREVHRLFDLIGRGAAKLENGHEWTAQLLAGGRGEDFAEVLGALEHGAIEALTIGYIQRFLAEKNLTMEEFKQQVGDSVETAMFLFGFGRYNGPVSEKLKKNPAVKTFLWNEGSVEEQLWLEHLLALSRTT